MSGYFMRKYENSYKNWTVDFAIRNDERRSDVLCEDEKHCSVFPGEE